MFEGYAQLSDVRLWYRDTGGDGPALVLCHPGSQSCAVWEHQLGPLSRAGYRVIAYSRRGYFRSESGDPASTRTVLDDLDEFLDHLGLASVQLLGAAAGGIGALAFAATRPERVRRLILAGTIFSVDEPDWREMYGRLGIRAMHDLAPVEFLELGPAYRAAEPAGTARFKALAAQAAPRAANRQPPGGKVSWRDLEAMKLPVLLLTGEADLYAPPPLQALVARHLQDVKCLTLSAIGHAPYWEDPDRFNAAVLAFLKFSQRL